MLNVVLVSPRIPGNVGTVGRTCVGFGARLHVCGPLGFALDSKELARAKIDYWEVSVVLHCIGHCVTCRQLLDVHIHANFAVLERDHGAALLEGGWFFSAHGTQQLDRVKLDAPAATPRWLVFGSESKGLSSVRVM